MVSTAPDLNGIYYDSEDDQNDIVIINGIYFLEHEHLTERGSIVQVDGEFELTIAEGDREGAPPYRIQITKQDGMNYQFLQDGKPFLNQSGIYVRVDDPEELAEYADDVDDNPITDELAGGGWMDDDSIHEMIHELNKKQSSDTYIEIMNTIQACRACDWSSALPRLRELAAGKDETIAAAARKTMSMIG